MPQVETFLRDLTIVLTVAAVTTVLCQRLRLPVVVGYILAGVVTGPSTPLHLVADTTWIRTLSELGVILLMYSIGLEFSLRRLGRLLPITGPAAAIETGLMVALGYLGGQVAGWTPLESLFTGAVVAISSTMIVAKAFEDSVPSRRLQDLVFGVLIIEDLVAILLLVGLTAVGTGRGLDGGSVIETVGQLIGFLAVLLAGGMLVVPRAMRAVVALKREETTLVAAVGVAFLFALLAQAAGYSVALGAFLAGALVRESGVAHKVIGPIRPVRDIFAAIFFVAVGMLVEPALVFQAWPVVLALTVTVLVGKLIGVTLGGFLAGFGLRTAVQAGMTLAQIGEFSFVIAAAGLASGAAPPVLYPAAVSVSVLTALLTPTLMRLADPLSAVIDRKLPKPIQTVVTLYESWVELLRRRTKPRGIWQQIRRPLNWMLLDAIVIVGVTVLVSRLRVPLRDQLLLVGVPLRYGMAVLFLLGLAMVLPFAIGLVTSARRFAIRFAEAAMPRAAKGIDSAHAPRGALVASIQFATVMVLGLPLLAITQPLLSAWPAAAVMVGLLLLLTISFWRSARDLQGHARAGAELIVDVLARQGIDKDQHSIEVVQDLLPGMGTIVPFRVDLGSKAVDRSLGELNLRGLTGASVVALSRGGQRIVFPKAHEVLREGDVLALTGSHDAISAAHQVLGKSTVEAQVGWVG
ncbi:MAG TPA: cation:proton antiporter [Gemmatimonadales bacterium]